MHAITVTTDTAANAKFLAFFLKKVRYVKSVSVNPPLKGKFNWISPSRPATDEELEQMLAECEASALLSAEEARKKTLREIKEWRKQR